MKTSRLPLILNLWIGCVAWTWTSSAAIGADNNEGVIVKQSSRSALSDRRYTVGIVDYQWFDQGRSRLVPVRIYYPAKGYGPFPLVLFSHGLGRSREECAYLGIHWAARGYVSVFVEHIGSNEAVWRGQRQPMRHLKAAYDNPATMRNRPFDLLFALDRLRRLQKQDDPLAERMDFTRIGAAGCDIGAQAALGLAGQILPGKLSVADGRIRAVVAMSPTVPAGQVPLDIAYQEVRVPCLYMTGSEDDGIVGSTKAYQRRLPFDHTSGADQYLAIFFGGDHMIYGGHIRAREADKDARFQPLIRDASTLFWDAYLKEKPEALASIQAAGLNALLGGSASVEKKLVVAKHPYTFSGE